MKKVLLLCLSVLVLSACNPGVELKYRLDFDAADEARQTVLTNAAVNVIKRRTARFQEELPTVGVSHPDGSTVITIEVENQEVADTLHQELTAPFIVDFMIAVEEGKPFDATVEGHGNFQKTALTGEAIDAVAPRPDETDATKARLVLAFTESGAAIMQSVFRENVGGPIGLFVSHQLAAKITVEETIPEQAVIISGIPSPELAEVFSDDVNVGLHVTFVPVE